MVSFTSATATVESAPRELESQSICIDADMAEVLQLLGARGCGMHADGAALIAILHGYWLPHFAHHDTLCSECGASETALDTLRRRKNSKIKLT